MKRNYLKVIAGKFIKRKSHKRKFVHWRSVDMDGR